MKITKRQLRKLIKETEEFKPRYKGDTPAKQGSGGWLGDPKVNMDFQRNDPGDEGGFDGSMMDWDDYDRLVRQIDKIITNFTNMGYTREDILHALSSVLEEI